MFCYCSANKNRVDCYKPNLPDLTSTAVQLRRRKNIAVIDVSANAVTAKRFGIEQDTCFKILL